MIRLSVFFIIAVILSACSRHEESGYRFAVIPKGSTHVFWRSIHAGAVKAEREFNDTGVPVEIIWKGSLQEDNRTAQIYVVENFIGQQVNGIVLAPLDDTAIVAPVDKAYRAGIPVVVIDSGLNYDKYVSFIATDNFNGGQIAGEYLVELLKGKGRVIMLRVLVGSASGTAREEGFLEVMKKHPGIELLSTNKYAGATRDTAQSASQNLLNRFGDVVDGIYTPNESSTNGMLLALRSIGRAGGQVKFVGLDGGEQNVQGLEKGDIQGLVIQDPFKMGYLGVKTMIEHLQGTIVEKRIDTGATLVTLNNIQNEKIQNQLFPPLDEYLEY